jgi:hypothetical protein
MEGNFIAKGLPLPPSTDQIAKCVYRTIDKDNTEEMALFKVYVKEFLPLVIGRRKEFGTNTSHYQTILEATGSPKGVKVVTPQDEAMLLAILYDSVVNSCEVFFMAKKDFKAANKGTKTKTTIVYNKQPEPGQPEVTVDDKNNLCLYRTKCKPKYSNCNAGSDQCAGWVKEGVKFYRDAWRKAVQARASPECKALEMTFLDWVKKDQKQPPPKPQDTTTKKCKAEEPPLYADIDLENSDDEGKNQKVAAAVPPQPKEDNDYKYDDDYEEEEVLFERLKSLL